ncbi:MAG: trehalose-6-phosphate synthase [Dehalococcoidales bacterium]|nr:trehalose-6-phosphate synthase [Dehalococcoidales bacterium]
MVAANQKNTGSRLEEFCSQNLSPRNIILASNRGPIEYHLTEDKQLQPHRGSGGVVTALSSLAKYVELNWIASVMGEGDRLAALKAQKQRFRVPLSDENLYLQFVINDRNIYHKYYSVICNPLLWFLQHYMWNSPRTPNIDHTVHDAWENGYIPVNQSFAQAVVNLASQSESPPIVMLNDYHLYLTSNYIREQMPNLVIQHFIHIPWPAPCYWQLLPNSMRQAIFTSLCTADIIGLQTNRDVLSFFQCCQSFIENAEINYQQQTIRTNDHLVHVKAYPISIDVTGLKKMVSSSIVKEYERELQPLYGEQTIVRVDRAEPSKNIIRGFRAFDALLTRYPQFIGKVKFIAFLVPTRTHLRPYKRYIQDVIQQIETINNKYKNENWHPIDYFYEHNYAQAIAGMRLYDVLIVNAVIDGMNLVAKEGPTVNKRDGVLILSETAGAHEQLGPHALTIAPADLEGTTQALYAALTMPAKERHQRANALKRSIETEDITNWLLCLLKDAVNLAHERY